MLFNIPCTTNVHWRTFSLFPSGETKTFLYSPLIVIFIGILGVFAVLILVLVLVTRWRRNSSSLPTASITRMPPPSPPPSSKPALPSVRPPEEVIREGALKKPINEDDPVQKPKKRVMVLENGRVERTGVSDSPRLPDTSAGEAVNGVDTSRQACAEECSNVLGQWRHYVMSFWVET